MNIVIYATKDGLRTLYTTNEELAYLIAEERRSGANNDNSLGQSVYTIAFTINDSVYTKYMIVKDSQRSNALGFIAFSLLINNNKTLKGEEIINVLDELSKTYTDNYIKNNYLNRGEKNLIKEEWNFVGDILNKYKEQDKTQKNEELHSGTKDAAILYYKNEGDLREYFDKPFQEEYSAYKQVFLVSEDLKENPKNPLTVLSNSGIELKDIDLKNEYYYIKNYDPSKGILISANGKERSDRKNNNCIRSKWQVEISYSKDERCFWPIQPKGTLSNPDSEIYKYLELNKNNNQINIKYDAFNNPEPKIKTITIEIKDRKGNFIDDAEIQIGTKPWEKISGHRYECTFSGEDLIKTFHISIKKGDYSGKIDLIPVNQTGNVDLILQEHINVSFIVIDDIGIVNDYNIQIRNQQGDLFSTSKEPKFIGEDIDKSYDITILSNKYERKSFPYCPAKDENSKLVNLKFKQLTENSKEEKYELVIDDKFGKRSFKNKSIGKYVMIKPNFGCDANFGYEFIEWKYQEQSSKDYDGYYEAIFEKSWYNNKWSWIGSIALLVIVAFTLIFNLSVSDNPQSPNVFPEYIQNYVQGDSLILDTLKNYKQEFEKQKPDVQEKSQSIYDWFMGLEKQNDSTEYNGWKDNMKSIEDAINKRNLINDKKFKELIKLDYSSEQHNIETAIKNIDSSKYKEISNKLGNVNNKTLSEIAVAINEILKPKESSNDSESQVKQQEKKTEQIKETQIINREEQPQTPQKQTTKISSVKNEEIIQYLKGGELKKNKLEDYKKNSTDSKLRRSIDIVLKIWELGKNNTTYHSAQQSCNNDQNLKDSELNKILKNINEKEKREALDYAGLKNADDILKNLKRKL
ncbi:hypothetical protein [Flavobacterium cellulosilyticum]|uniref:Uncharacterized protein n=1 Tax=Flavobacterium cellulosilyticum TaxID=2541731 RepID=A0A4R5CH00_9FLAO|nr:hypothetical protein [Flavobacterium cellulosilyticum]TDD99391.1 hypothetical protein E0F76_01305 [Flavobacterium cellulosilyticum]